jgi:hypothetical protein
MPPRTDGAAESPKLGLLSSGEGRGDMLASIRQAGGLRALKKVPDSEKKIREAPLAIGGAKGGGPSSPPANPMAALQQALNDRKKKVANNSGELLFPFLLNIITDFISFLDDEDDGADW